MEEKEPYIVLMYLDIKTLQRHVARMRKEGYIECGGVSMAAMPGPQFAQAMVLK